MTFTTKKISPKYLAILDIGTYKIRASVCRFHNRDLELIGYGEKRQNSDDILGHDFVNLKGVCENIDIALDKAQKDACVQVDNIVVNIPFDDIFFQTAQINHFRENLSQEIDKQELIQLMENFEKQALKKHHKMIKSKYGYDKKELRLIISGISEIKADKQKTKKLLNTNPEEINISLLNIFIPEQKHEIIQTIGRFLGKKIVKVIPTEFAIMKLFKKKQDVVVIDIGSSHTSIIVKKDNKILGIQKHAFGIDSLISKIRKNYNRTKIEIIETIDQNIYEPEKNEFLEIFKDILVISLEEIVGHNICPNDFFMIGGGSNKFLRNYLSQADLNQNNLKIAQNIEFITPKIEYFDTIDSSKSNLNIYALMMSTLSFIKKEKDPVEESLKKAIENI